MKSTSSSSRPDDRKTDRLEDRSTDIPRIDRRLALKWIAGAATSLSIPGGNSPLALAADKPSAPTGYGPDPDVIKIYKPGDLWPLTFSKAQRRLVMALCDIIIPADDTSPGASSLGVHDFIDEWISSPYPGQAKDRALILKGLAWLDEEAARRDSNAKDFLTLPPETRLALCRDLAIEARKDKKKYPGSFFLRLRDLVSGGYYTTPAGMRDIGYVGNNPSPIWNGPTPEALAHLGLDPQ